MKTYTEASLARLAATVMEAGGCSADEAATVGRRLASANVMGHDSHGVLRVPQYIAQLREGSIRANQSVSVVTDRAAVLVLDGKLGFGQVVGEQATRRGIARAGEFGIALVGLRNAGHVGRVGDWAELAAAAGLASLHFVNTLAGTKVAPYGGREGRLSTNPICCGVPVEGGPPIIADMTTSMVAAGKLMVARNAGKPVPEGWIIDRDGAPTTDPADFFDGGALLTAAGHKGYALSLIVDLFAGTLSAGRASNPDDKVMVNNMTSIFIDPAVFLDAPTFQAEVTRFKEWVLSSQPAAPGGEVIMAGEVEHRMREQRRRDGVPIDDGTIARIVETATSVGVSGERCRELLVG